MPVNVFVPQSLFVKYAGQHYIRMFFFSGEFSAIFCGDKSPTLGSSFFATTEPFKKNGHKTYLLSEIRRLRYVLA